MQRPTWRAASRTHGMAASAHGRARRRQRRQELQSRRSGLVRLLCLAAAAACTICAAAVEGEGEERLIGWAGETWNGSSAQGQRTVESSTPRTSSSQSKRWVETISWKPRAFVHHGLLTHAECDHLVELGSQRITRSLVVDSDTGRTKLDDIRTSWGAAFGRGEDSTIAAIQERIAEATHLSPHLFEPMQILRYRNGERYNAHWDWFSEASRRPQDGNRYATVVIYLSDVEEGGETTLPLAEALNASVQVLANPSRCAAVMGLAVKPRKGDALLFFDMDVAGQVGDRLSLHAACPALGTSVKWTATQWIRSKAMGSFDPLKLAAQCADVDRDCSDKERQGLCDVDPRLVGSTGTCRRTCKDCVQCAEHDLICYRGNMRGRRIQSGVPSS